jgi:hypothetical protein
VSARACVCVCIKGRRTDLHRKYTAIKTLFAFLVEQYLRVVPCQWSFISVPLVSLVAIYIYPEIVYDEYLADKVKCC